LVIGLDAVALEDALGPGETDSVGIFRGTVLKNPEGLPALSRLDP
jgi:hypothetical protein